MFGLLGLWPPIIINEFESEEYVMELKGFNLFYGI